MRRSLSQHLLNQQGNYFNNVERMTAIPQEANKDLFGKSNSHSHLETEGEANTYINTWEEREDN